MSFTSDVKGEICQIQYDDICCVRAELTGMVCFGAAIQGDSIRLRTEHAIVAQRFYALIHRLYHLEATVTQRESGLFVAEVWGLDALKLLRDMKLSTVPLRIHRDIVRNECCKMALIRGAFLGSGSMSAPTKGYHAELATTHFALCEDIISLLSPFGIPPKKINRNGTFVLYLKDSEHIENLLALLGAHNRMMDFLNVKIEKDLRNKTNRLANCDVANLQKTVDAAIAQRGAILSLLQRMGPAGLPVELRAVANARLDAPEASLAELAKELGISKSGVNHRMRKLMELANHTNHDSKSF